MNSLKRLEKMLLNSHITKEEYLKRREAYIDAICKLYMKELISEEEVRERLD